ncbi:uncharacterized protein LOC129964027 [Argiope bruennichi]|uniref:uncharacterized protein LOC129964027 n=1 Tax=Argiope bruennichi TaxID=94029 RepID=UPI002494D2AC|nr:uncharacterized protein LOC129964027 [Argiope bruennichi]
MCRLPILCVLLIIAVYATAELHSSDVEDTDELSDDIDSSESFENDALDADWNNFYRRKPHDHSKEKKSKENKHSKEKKSKENKHSKEKKSKEKKHSREDKNRPIISDDAVFLPHERFCKYFYEFDGSEARLLSCPKGHRFDAEKLQCLKSKEVDCGKRKKNVDSSEENKARINFKCPRWYGLHKHEYYCHLYYNCQYKRVRLFMCPQGMLFDENRNSCESSENVDCKKRIDPSGDNELRPTVKPEGFVCPSKSGKFPHERDCSAFYKCENRKYKIHYCSKGKLYNERKRNCESENKVTCGSRIHPDLDPDEPEDKVVDPRPKFNCNQNFGRFTHEAYCNWYYQCHDRLPSIRECRRGRRYHSHRRRCLDKHEVTCDGKPDKEDPITEEITTTPISTESDTPSEPETTPTAPETTPTEPETTPTEPETTPTEPETTPSEPETTPSEPETTPTETETTPTETETTPTEPEVTPSEPETTPSEPETTPSEPETTPSEPETTPSEPETTPSEPETTPSEPETTPSEPETTTTTTTEEPTTTQKPKVTAPDTDCDEDDVDCIIDDLGITPDWFVCPEDIGSYPHPSSRKLFIFCLNWKPSVKKCGQDLLYSEDLRTCVHP